jgi:hypothetical protein
VPGEKRELAPCVVALLTSQAGGRRELLAARSVAEQRTHRTPESTAVAVRDDHAGAPPVEQLGDRADVS